MEPERGHIIRTAVPRYFFSLSNGDDYIDHEGQELPHVHAARTAAVEAARDIIAEEAKRGRIPLKDKIVISDCGGAVVETLLFGDAVRIDH